MSVDVLICQFGMRNDLRLTSVSFYFEIVRGPLMLLNPLSACWCHEINTISPRGKDSGANNRPTWAMLAIGCRALFVCFHVCRNNNMSADRLIVMIHKYRQALQHQDHVIDRQNRLLSTGSCKMLQTCHTSNMDMTGWARIWLDSA